MDNFKKCIWITNTIASAGEAGISLNELNNKWGKLDDDPIPPRTFFRLKENIADIFGIDIECDKSRNAYYIPYRDELFDGKLKMWLFNSFALHNRLSSDPQLRNRVLFEDTPGGTHWLDDLLDAIQKCLKINFSYQKSFEGDCESYTDCKPMALRVFKQRWYLIAYKNDGSLRIFALDRIHSLQNTTETFQMPKDFNLEHLFDETFGMFLNPEIQTEKIVIKSDIAQSEYLKSLPLHHSQRILEETDQYVIITWTLKPTYDFIQQLLTMNTHIEVMEPLSLRKTIAQMLREMLEKYKYSNENKVST